MVLTLSLLTLTSISISWADNEFCWDDTFEGEYFLVCNEEGRKRIDLLLIERDGMEEELEAQVDSKPALRLFWFGLGVVAGGVTYDVISR